MSKNQYKRQVEMMNASLKEDRQEPVNERTPLDRAKIEMAHYAGNILGGRLDDLTIGVVRSNPDVHKTKLIKGLSAIDISQLEPAHRERLQNIIDTANSGDWNDPEFVRGLLNQSKSFGKTS